MLKDLLFKHIADSQTPLTLMEIVRAFPSYPTEELAESINVLLHDESIRASQSRDILYLSAKVTHNGR